MIDSSARLSREDAETIAKAAAKATVRETFRLLGVDLDNQQSVNDFRADLVYARKIRRLSEKTGSIALLVMISAIVTGMLAVFWDGIKAHFK